MNDHHLRKYYQMHGSRVNSISPQEQLRIAATLDLVPSSWKTVIDVGCGDGRISAPLIEQGIEVVGLDWAETSLEKFPGKKAVADIRQSWPFNDVFDGAICAEVLEHLHQPEAIQVVDLIKQHTRKGFIISVPARESLETHTTSCPACNRPYHVWGHFQSFASFETLDELVGIKSCIRTFVPYNGIKPSVLLDRIKRNLGYYPCGNNTLCPFCGTLLPKPGRPPLSYLGLLWLLGKIEAWTNSLRPTIGWFVCRYNL